MVAYPLVLLALSNEKWAGLTALALAGAFGALGGSVAQAMVADLVAPERRQSAYASVRVAANMGVVVGPPLGGALFQVRLTRLTTPIPPAPKLVIALLVMGLPFALLVWTHSLAAIVFVIVVFVVGEMLWVPTSQAVVAELAPADIRGAAMGAFGSAPAIGFAIAPLIGLQARNSFGDETTWALFAVIGVVAAMLGGLALAGLDRRAGPEPSAVLEA